MNDFTERTVLMNNRLVRKRRKQMKNCGEIENEEE